MLVPSMALRSTKSPAPWVVASSLRAVAHCVLAALLLGHVAEALRIGRGEGEPVSLHEFDLATSGGYPVHARIGGDGSGTARPSAFRATNRLAGTRGNMSQYVEASEVVRPVRRPPGQTPCAVTLVRDANFSTFEAAANFSFTPPNATLCGSSWQLVLLTISADVAGIQYDRRLTVQLGGLMLLVATTAQPRRNGTRFGVERDVTHLSAFFRSGKRGSVVLPNPTSDIHTGIYYVTAQLLFFRGTPAEPPPDVVLPAPNAALRIPRNAYRARLEVFVSHYQSDEFFYTSLAPEYFDSLSAQDQQGFYRGSAYREVVASLDGAPVGVILPQPLLYSGAFNPVLWLNFMGIGSLSMPTFSLELTPFLPWLLDGRQHSLQLNVSRAARHSLWITSGALLLWRDPRRNSTSGKLIRSSFPSRQPRETIDGLGSLNAYILTQASGGYEASGFVVSSFGNLTTEVSATMRSRNAIRMSRAGYAANFQHEVESSTSMVTFPRGQRAQPTRSESWEDRKTLDVGIDLTAVPDTQQSYTQFTRASQTCFLSRLEETRGGGRGEQVLNSQDASSNFWSAGDSYIVASTSQSYQSVGGNGDTAPQCLGRKVHSTYEHTTGFVLNLNTSSTTCPRR